MCTIMAFLLFLIFSGVASKNCNVQTSCGQCIQTPNCFWVMDADHAVDGTFCLPLSQLKNVGSRYVYNPQNSMFLIKNRSLDEVVLVAPQHIKLTLRKQTPVSLHIATKIPNDNLRRQISIEHFRVRITKVASTHTVIEVEATECPQNATAFHQTITLQTTRSRQVVTIEITLNCRCSWEQPENNTQNARECNNRGVYLGGVCKCNRGTYGEHCQCSDYDLTGCEDPETSLICSGQGICQCGRCACREAHDICIVIIEC